jgi:trans-2,3-dihydro-3-hydroxyanthranilate isomerase
MQALDYFLCDVFTRQPMSGNQLAVFPDAGDLTDEQMQAIAREMNLSETTFVHRRDALTEAARGYRVRIFTVKEELPFAGHPTLGTAAVIRRFVSENRQAGRVRLDENAGVVPVEFDDSQGGDGVVYGEMTQPKAELGEFHARRLVAEALGLDEWDISPDLAPQTVSTGMPVCVAPLRGVDALKYMRLNAAKEAEALKATGAMFLYAIARESDGLWQARMQFYGGEDPATGSAAGCATAYLVGNGVEEPERTICFRQGMSIDRPSDIFGRAKREGGQVSDVRVAGCTVFVARGQFFLEGFT